MVSLNLTIGGGNLGGSNPVGGGNFGGSNALGALSKMFSSNSSGNGFDQIARAAEKTLKNHPDMSPRLRDALKHLEESSEKAARNSSGNSLSNGSQDPASMINNLANLIDKNNSSNGNYGSQNPSSALENLANQINQNNGSNGMSNSNSNDPMSQLKQILSSLLGNQNNNGSSSADNNALQDMSNILNGGSSNQSNNGGSYGLGGNDSNISNDLSQITNGIMNLASDASDSNSQGSGQNSGLGGNDVYNINIA